MERTAGSGDRIKTGPSNKTRTVEQDPATIAGVFLRQSLLRLEV